MIFLIYSKKEFKNIKDLKGLLNKRRIYLMKKWKYGELD